ncbi:MAG: hypothetical protein DMG30_14470 [Acidobacteria bacterium]|nr:MAG: hypothetical protein DMG30_14470 [Acidobacteriota bacterium]
MRNLANGCVIGLAGVLFFSSYAWSQNRQANQPIRADDGKTLYDKASSTGSGGPAPRQDLTGFWTGPITAKLNPVPPMTPWGQEQFRSHKNHSQYSEAESNDPMKYCDPMGFPRDMLYDNRGFAFAPMPGKVLQAFQFNRVWREIWTDGRELPKNVGGRSADAADPRWYGYSVGHWEGDYTFVVDTVGSDERTWLDSVGHPHSIDMYVQERYKRVDHNTLEMTMTIDDPKTYTKPFVITNARFRWLVNQDLVEEICVPSLMQEYLKIIADPAGEVPGK